ncbi:hypothetical protein [Lysobacter capsici]|uniref:hypothetical protein n=1 Tax=Lysobacter capsici TaxID=435897 RepID=UPI001C00617B|nr:hypothetical protein [Lysobacter capsici]QWF18523.1 hypothetical protein KME82_07145 [Lysobacter capsici]
MRGQAAFTQRRTRRCGGLKRIASKAQDSAMETNSPKVAGSRFNANPMRASKRALPVVLAFVAVVALIAWSMLREYHLSGDEFRRVLKPSVGNSYGYWLIYHRDHGLYCFKTPHPMYFPDWRYCVAETEIELIRNGKAVEVNDYLGVGDVVLNPDRYPGAKREVL